MERKTLKRVERKMLVFNKMKRKGLSYDQACKELESELEFLNKQREAKKHKPAPLPPNFQEEFAKLTK